MWEDHTVYPLTVNGTTLGRWLQLESCIIGGFSFSTAYEVYTEQRAVMFLRTGRDYQILS